MMENILFKVSYPAEFHAQTAAECAIILHQEIKERLDDIEKITITTHESAIRIIDKVGPLNNPADRDHCIQYITALGLLYGDVVADHYEDDEANDSRIDQLRNKMIVVEDEQYSKDYLDPSKRSIANAVQVTFKDGSTTDKVVSEYPLGHRFRREEAIPQIREKFSATLMTHYPEKKRTEIEVACESQSKLEQMNVIEFVDLFLL